MANVLHLRIVGSADGERAVGLRDGTCDLQQIWQIDDNGFAFDPPEAWGHDDTTEVYRYPAYARAMAIWELIDTIKPLRPRLQGSTRPCAPTLHRRIWPRPTECVLPRHSSG
jgi:hypothetical protein